MELDWLKPQVDAWRTSVAAGRVPHAVMLAGTPGVGKRALAVWLAKQQLQTGVPGPLPGYPADLPAHPDLYRVCPPEDRKFILIDQVRELVSELSLTSHAGRGKVAIIEPADAMTGSAANSLLKTLEEPPGHALLVLIADRPGRVQPTVRSRCQRLNIGIPTESGSLAWLGRWQPGGNWGAALRQAGGAPLAALAAHERLAQTDAMLRDFGGVAAGRVSPLDVAGRWAKEEPEFVLDWLCRQLQQCIHRAFGSAGGAAVADSVLNRIDRRNLFCYLDIINALRGQPAGSFNVQLTLESLLIDWARGLKNCRQPNNPAAMTPSGAG